MVPTHLLETLSNTPYLVLITYLVRAVGVAAFEDWAYQGCPRWLLCLAAFSVDPFLIRTAPVCCDFMLSPIEGEIAGADHDPESALKGIFVASIARAGPWLEHQVAEVQRGAAEIEGYDMVELVVSRVDVNVRGKVALDRFDRVPRWPDTPGPSAPANCPLNVVLRDAGVGHDG
jgi:hypothetical protein